MSTHHHVFYKSAQEMGEIASNSVALVITSPPYPMIEMWDEIFTAQNPKIGEALASLDGNRTFKLMHAELNKVWEEVARIIQPGGIVCINIGDATRTVADQFQLFPSHAQIIHDFHQLGFQSLPEILWRKPTNAPNKFMGSGMFPPGAYVTLEHEYILIFRKGNKREFKDKGQKEIRRESAYFWEERNQWFSDLWEFVGKGQILKGTETRDRSGAFPFELPFRIINMFSIKGDLVVDPFVGMGTSILAAMASERNSIGYEIDAKLRSTLEQTFLTNVPYMQNYVDKRLENHLQFVEDRQSRQKPLKYTNNGHNFLVMTSQEQKLHIRKVKAIEMVPPDSFTVHYE